MEKTYKNQNDKALSADRFSTLDLLGRQTVRATFRLSEACIDTISALSAQLGIKQKSVFDHLLEDDEILKSMASELEKIEFDRSDRIQKTYVISRRSLTYLDTISDEFNAPRDAIVERSIRRLMPIIARERKKHRKRKALLSEISNHFEMTETLLSKARENLGGDDPVVKKLSAAMSAYRSAFEDISSFIDRGKIIEKFQPE